MIEYLKKEYAKHHWPSFLVQELKNKGVFDPKLANELAAKGRVKKDRCMHGTLIVIIIEDDGFWETN